MYILKPDTAFRTPVTVLRPHLSATASSDTSSPTPKTTSSTPTGTATLERRDKGYYTVDGDVLAAASSCVCAAQPGVYSTQRPV